MKRYLSVIAVVAALFMAGCSKAPETTPEKTAEIKIDGTPSITISGENQSGEITMTATVDWTAKPNVAWLKVVPESGKGSDKPVTIKVTCDPNTDPQPREAKITITAGGVTKEISIIQEANPKQPQAVDLGLSVKWADRNVGATSAEEYGDYYSWGETQTKDNYDYQTCKWFGVSTEIIKKYSTKAKCGMLDNNIHLDEEDDVAHTLYGDKWRLATEDEWKELITKCSWVWKGDESNKGGYEVTGSNGKSIYLPAAGMYQSNLSAEGYNGFYWAANVPVKSPTGGVQMQMNPANAKMTNLIRFFGCSVRPVLGDIVRVKGISLDKTRADLILGETVQLTASLTPENAFEKGVLWSSSNPDVATVTTDFTDGGLVRAISPGEATITATSVDGNFKATFSVKASAVVFEATASNISSVLEMFNANGAQMPLLILKEDIPESITITREDGVIDFGGHTVSKEMFIQNNTEGKSVILRNGKLASSLDGKADWYDFYKGTVILENLTVTGTIFTDGHMYEFLSGKFQGSIENYVIDGYPGKVIIRGGYFDKGFELNGEDGFRHNCEKGYYVLYGGMYKINPSKDNISRANGYYIQNTPGEERENYPFRVVEG